ncbi:TPA: glycoside hydrolase N-terminal domain-containing protein [Streptococcus suis]
MRNRSKELFDKRHSYSIRKFTVGVASVAIGCLLLGHQTELVHANSLPDTTDQASHTESETLSPQIETLLEQVARYEQLVDQMKDAALLAEANQLIATILEAIDSQDQASIEEVSQYLPEAIEAARQAIEAQSSSSTDTPAEEPTSSNQSETGPELLPNSPQAEAPSAPSSQENSTVTNQSPTDEEAADKPAETASQEPTASAPQVEATENTSAQGGEAHQETPAAPAIPTSQNSPYILHYQTPAATSYQGWEKEALPVGNGEIGNKLFGLVGAERIQFNEKTLWSGGPKPHSTTYNGGNRLGKHEYLDDIRQALENGNLEEAKRLAQRHLVGPNNPEYGRYLAFGDIDIDITNASKDIEQVTDYKRSLDITTAISSTDYNHNGTHYHRETFVSYPDNVSVTHFKNTGSQPLDLDIRMALTDALVSSNFTSYIEDRSDFKEGRVTYSQDGILLSGKVKNNDLKFAAFIKLDTDGRWSVENDKLRLTGASYATLYLSAETDFAQDPKTNYRDKEIQVEAFVKETATKAASKGFEAVKRDHITDYQTIFNRVSLNLNTVDSKEPTKQLLASYSQENGQELEELFFQFGRYLMITSSRDGKNALPANLQGVWNAVDNPPWNSDYHLNVNLQMNYWPVYSTNMAETAIPLIKYINDMRYYGRIAAKEYANVVSNEGEENGWLAHTQATPFGWTTPGWSYYWGWSPASNAWIMQNVYDYYKFTKDEAYLKSTIYPMLKETAKFWNSFLHYDRESDRWVSSPSYSPEHGTITIGNTYDQSLVWQLFHDFMEAAKILDTDQELVAQIKEKYEKLKPLHINSEGRIKEWYEEDTSKFTAAHRGQPGHRHVSELVGLFPGTLFSKDSPQYLEAAKATLNHRGDGGTGWSKANKINLWARLLDGNRAHRLLSEQLKSSTLTNLWDTHPPFQIDGNFGATSGMTEMLLQSHSGYIALLPALPDAWASGQVTGLMARGNVQVDMTWSNKNLDSVRLLSNKGGPLIIDYPNVETARLLVNGVEKTFTTIQEGRISIDTKAGDVVTLEQITARINDLAAKRTGARTAELTFSAIKDAVGYQIERIKLASEEEGAVKYFRTTETSFTDRTLLPNYDYHYRVRPIFAQTAKAYSDYRSVAKLKDLLDDRDPSIQYGSAFGDWADKALWSGTEKFADISRNPAIAAEQATATIPFIGTGIEIYGIKNSNLGKAIVTIDGQVVEELDFHKPGAEQAEKGVLIGRYAGLTEGPHLLTIRVKPDSPTRANETNKISLDYFKILRDTSQEYDILDDRDERIRYGSIFHPQTDSALYATTETYGERSDNSSDEEASLVLEFDGRAVQIYGNKSRFHGKAQVAIDDKIVGEISFHQTGNGTDKAVLVGEYGNLTKGHHTLKLTVLPTSIRGGLKKISLDRFVILKEDMVEERMTEEIGPEISFAPSSTALSHKETPEKAESDQLEEAAPSVPTSQTVTDKPVETVDKPQTIASPDLAVTESQENETGTENKSETGLATDKQTLPKQTTAQTDTDRPVEKAEQPQNTASPSLSENETGTGSTSETQLATDSQVQSDQEGAISSENLTSKQEPFATSYTHPLELIDETTGVRVLLEVGESTAISGLLVKLQETEEELATSLLKGLDYDLYDIVLVNQSQQTVSPTRETLVTLLSDPGKVVEKVVYLPNATRMEELAFTPATIFDKDGKPRAAVSFVTKHFSLYGIIYRSQPAEVTPATKATYTILASTEPELQTAKGEGTSMPLPSLSIGSLASHQKQSETIQTSTKAKAVHKQLPRTGSQIDYSLTLIGLAGLAAASSLAKHRRKKC